MNIQYLIQMLQNKITILNSAKSQATSIGDLDQLNSIEKDLLDTQSTFNQLVLLANIANVAASVNTTPADLMATGVDAIKNAEIKIQGPSAGAIVSGYDISAYATDPNHEQIIKNILSTMPAFMTVLDIDTYIHKIAETSPITGKMVATASGQYNVDIPLMLAIMQNDSQFGTEGVGARTNNPGNIGNTGLAEKMYSSWDEGVNAVAEWLNRHRVTGTILTQNLPQVPTVTEPILTSISVVPSTANIITGNTQQIITNTLDQNGSILSGASITFSSNNNAVATVDNTGLVTAISDGMATITARATLNNRTATGNSTIIVNNSVIEPVLTSITVAPTAVSILVGTTQQLSASPLNHNGGSISDAKITFSSDNTAVATVDNTGLVTAISDGMATITAEATLDNNTISANSIITVSNPVPVSVLSIVMVTPVSASIIVGATQQLVANSLDQNGSTFTDSIITFSSDNTSVATVDNTGLVTAISAGTANITAQAVFGETVVTGKSVIIVSDPEVLPQDPNTTNTQARRMNKPDKRIV